MEAIEGFVSLLNGFVWGGGYDGDNVVISFFQTYPPVLLLLLGVGLYLTIRLKFMPIQKIPYAFGQLFKKRPDAEEGDVSPFGALMTALSSTIGTGNIAGVAAAIAIGGPGAVFWMWMTALVGMASKYCEGVLAVKFREIDEDGRHVGGPMYYIKNGLGKGWFWLAITFAAFGVLASWGTGSYIQANSIADAVQSNYGIPPWVSGLVLAGAAAAVILGGITRIAAVAEKLVPAMAISYMAAGLIVIGMNAPEIPHAFARIFAEAFGFKEMATGTAIGLMLLAMQKGVARGIFSNEAGQGSAPIAHAAAQNKDPVNQGIVAMLGTFIDTILVCTVTALVIMTANIIPEMCEPFVRPDLAFLPEGCETGAPLTVNAFEHNLPGIGSHIVAIGLAVFGFTTILGWSYYGERCAEFLFGTKIILPFKLSWVFFTFFGAAALMLENLEGVTDAVSLFWLVADTLTGLMAAPNLIALLVLSPMVAAMTKAYFARSDTPKG